MSDSPNYQLSLKSIFVLMAIAAVAALLFKAAGFHVERFLAAVALFVVVMFYVIQGLRILVNENKTAGQAYRQLKRLLGETEDQ
ncbi:hypothetical protein ACYFX5_18560 [Bremerella sp. T1]|uniref:hypothetical protein n=1 Tax=Bremerella sp. TYQ1 TaxID=3119568 RepID=UPI001CCE2B0E|nr:hypothetical protein [Bremerella volcania]UBM35052.1 hypothetical protein LA756_20510 [Bremerella volcania]